MTTDLARNASAPPATHAMGQERDKLKKSLRRIDLVFITLAALIAIDTIAVTAAVGGGQTLVWLIVLIAVYLVPYGMIVSELGSAFPYEGGPYVWTRLAYGRLAGAYTATFYWMSNPVWVGSTVAAVVVAAVNSLILPDNPLGTWGSIAVGLGVVWACTALSWIELKWGKWAGAIGTIVRLLTLAVFLILVVVFLVKNGKPAGTIAVSDLKPTIVGFLAVIGLLQFLFVGFELSSGASEEMKDPQKDIPKMIVRSGIIASLVTGSMILGVLLVMPGDALSKVAGFTDAYASVAGVLGGASTAFNYLVAALVILTAISTGTVWQQGTVRVQAVAALDGAAPLWMGRFSKSGTPFAMNILSTLIGSAFVIIVFLVAKGSLEAFFAVTIAVTISLTAMMYLLIFPSVITLRRKYPDRRRPFHVPGGRLGLWLSVIGAEAIIVITSITLLWPGLLDNLLGQSYDISLMWGVSRGYFETVTLSIVGFFLLVTVIFWLWGRHNIDVGLVGENDLLDAAAARPARETGDIEVIRAPAAADAG
jgi:glutamate:GABA antiporter